MTMRAAASSVEELPETRCPACGATINVSGLGRRRKVQCPKCREIVEMSTASPPVPARVPAPPEISPAELAELRARVSRLEELEARVAVLERGAAPPANIHFLETPAPPPDRKLRWLAPSEEHHAEQISQTICDILRHNLAAFAAHTVTMRCVLGDGRAQRRADTMRQVFEQAKWTVHGPTEVASPPGDRGLTLAVGSLPMPPDASAAYLAFTASGFLLETRIDPSMRGQEVVVVVG